MRYGKTAFGLWCLLAAVIPAAAAKYPRRKTEEFKHPSRARIFFNGAKKGGKKAPKKSAPGAVYAMTNVVAGVGNSVVVYDRAADGTLKRVGLFDTGGLGGLAAGNGDIPAPEEDPLASQGSLILSENNYCLLAVNAGSNTFTVFRVRHPYLERVGIYDSGGDFPVSIAQFKNLVYVLNSGGVGTVSGYRFREQTCEVRPIPGSVVSLENDLENPPFFVFSPAQVSFDPWGQFLIVTNKGENEINTYGIESTGLLGMSTPNPSSGNIPFSFDFDDYGNLLVSEAFGSLEVGSADGGAVSSYSLTGTGTLNAISESVGNGQTASCWLKHFDGVAFVTNNIASTMSTYTVDSSGNIALLEDVAAGMSSDGIFDPIDLDLTDDGEYLYVLNAGSGTISLFRNSNGALEFLEEFEGVSQEIDEREGEGPAGIAVF